jgi:hypothetical protein
MAKSKRTRAPDLPKGKITKADIEAKLRELSGGIEEGAGWGRRIGPWALGTATVIVVVYRLGLTLGARNSTLLEVRRISSPG